MLFDANLMFDGGLPSTGGITGVNVFTNGSSQASSNVLNLLNARDLGMAPQGKATLQIFCLVTTAFSGGTSLNVQFQGSTDNVTYTTYAETGAIPVASLSVGKNIFNQVIPGVQPEDGALPQYYRLNYVCVGNVTAGAVISGLTQSDDNRYYAPGIAVAN